MSEIHYESATRLMSRLDAREIGARELLDHFLGRVERHNPAINAIVWQDADRARAEGRRLGPAPRGGGADRPPRRPPGDREGELRPRRLPHHLGRSGAPRQHRGHGLGRRREVPRGRGGGLRQDQRPVHAVGLAELQLDLRHLQQSVGPHPYPRRLLRRIGGRARGGADGARRGLRHRRLDPQPGALLRGLRPQADLGDRLRPRPGVAGRPWADRHRGRRPPRPLGGGLEARLRPPRRRRRPRRAGVAADPAGAAPAGLARLPGRRPAERPPSGGGAVLSGRHRGPRRLARRRRRDRRGGREARLLHRERRWRSTRCCFAPRPPSG